MECNVSNKTRFILISASENIIIIYNIHLWNGIWLTNVNIFCLERVFQLYYYRIQYFDFDSAAESSENI